MVTALAGLLVICVVQAAIFGWALTKLVPNWTERRRVFTAAAPVPALVFLLCLILLVRTLLRIGAQCGPDGCGMAIVAALIGMVYAVSGFGLALSVARFAIRRTAA